jgi:hypothetical protein
MSFKEQFLIAVLLFALCGLGYGLYQKMEQKNQQINWLNQQLETRRKTIDSLQINVLSITDSLVIAKAERDSLIIVRNAYLEQFSNIIARASHRSNLTPQDQAIIRSLAIQNLKK